MVVLSFRVQLLQHSAPSSRLHGHASEPRLAAWERSSVKAGSDRDVCSAATLLMALGDPSSEAQFAGAMGMLAESLLRACSASNLFEAEVRDHSAAPRTSRSIRAAQHRPADCRPRSPGRDSTTEAERPLTIYRQRRRPHRLSRAAKSSRRSNPVGSSFELTRVSSLSVSPKHAGSEC